MEYKFSGEITLEDYIQFNRFVCKKHFILYKITTPVAALLAIVAIVREEWFLTVIMLAMVWLGIVILFSKKVYKKHLTANKLMSEDGVFTINEELIDVTKESTKTTLRKEKIYKIECDKDSIYIFTSPLSAFIIKKRYLKDDNEFEALREFIKKHYTSAA